MQTQPTHDRRTQHKTLIVVSGVHGHAMVVAQALSQRLQRRGHVVDVGDASLPHAVPAPTAYHAVIIGAASSLASDRRVLGDYIARHRAGLATVATGLFVVDEPSRRRRRRRSARDANVFASTISWSPNLAASLVLRDRTRMRSVVRYAIGVIGAVLAGAKTTVNADEIAELADAISRQVTLARSST